MPGCLYSGDRMSSREVGMKGDGEEVRGGYIICGG